jgi:murein DD-endopeptidase MepM/ murein hydrolase activator NlpD
MSLTSIPGDVTASAATSEAAARRAKVVELAGQFEAMMLAQILRQMRQSMLTDEDDGGMGAGLGAGTMTDTIDSELARTLSRSSRFGLADFIIRALDRQLPASASSDGATQPASLPAAGTAPALRTSMSVAGGAVPWAPVPALPAAWDGATDAVEPGSVAPALPSGPVSSAFGWRRDPITGQQRFHSGTDVKMAYGRDVLAATGGRVTFVGNQGGYGLTVVVDHGGGIETRYAHLSSVPIKEGEVVEPGQVIAQSGNSGRSTGPHLHFEVLSNGRAVDPHARAGLLAARDAPTD